MPRGTKRIYDDDYISWTNIDFYQLSMLSVDQGRFSIYKFPQKIESIQCIENGNIIELLVGYFKV